MMFGLMRVRTHDAEMAKVHDRLQHQVMAAGVYQQHYEDTLKRNADLTAENRTLQARLDALTPARGQGGRFAKREAV